MLTGIHFLLSYACTYECDHCFVYSSPWADGTFTINQVRAVLKEALKIGSVTTIFFEGGEPFLYYPLMLEGVGEAQEMGFDVGIVTNGYFATSEEDAELWLLPLRDLGISNLTISDDVLHNGDEKETVSKRAQEAAQKLEIPTGTISVESPSVETIEHHPGEKGEPVVGGGVMFRGRAAAKLTSGLPVKDWSSFDECPHEKLREPSRVHVDAFGNVQVCQGISMGNMWDTPLSELIRDYDSDKNPVLGPIDSGGPARLVQEYAVEHEAGYVDACHLCYCARKSLIDRFTDYLQPPQVYGL